jgi:hypothetical protein
MFHSDKYRYRRYLEPHTQLRKHGNTYNGQQSCFLSARSRVQIWSLTLRIHGFTKYLQPNRARVAQAVSDSLLDGRSGDRMQVEDEIFRAWGPHSLLYNGYRVSFPGVKVPGRGVNHSSLSRSEVKERIEPYSYSNHTPGLHDLFQGQLYLYLFTSKLIPPYPTFFAFPYSPKIP